MANAGLTKKAMMLRKKTKRWRKVLEVGHQIDSIHSHQLQYNEIKLITYREIGQRAELWIQDFEIESKYFASSQFLHTTE
jgi:hypothetical protein